MKKIKYIIFAILLFIVATLNYDADLLTTGEKFNEIVFKNYSSVNSSNNNIFIGKWTSFNNIIKEFSLGDYEKFADGIDISASGDGSVRLFRLFDVGSAEKTCWSGIYILSENGVVEFNEDSSSMFKNFRINNAYYKTGECSLGLFVNSDQVDTSKIKNASSMFENFTTNYNHAVTSEFYTPKDTLDLSWLDLSNVTNVSKMFAYTRTVHADSDIIKVKLNDNMANLDNTSEMFAGQENLKNILSSTTNSTYKFDLTNVTDASGMFSGDTFLQYLDLSATKQTDSNMAKDYSSMFENCKYLSDIELGDYFVTSKVRDISNMFKGCETLTTLDLSKFDTSLVRNLSGLFSGCKKLESINLLIDTSKVNNIKDMFSDCTGLRTINFGENAKFQRVQDFSKMFYGASKLKNLDLSNFQTDYAINMSSMFEGCSELENIIFGDSFNTENVFNMSSMFKGNILLIELDLSSFSADSVNNIQDMFNGCNSLETIYTSDKFNLFDKGEFFLNQESVGYNSSLSNNFIGVFEDCDSLSGKLSGAPNWDLFRAKNITNYFYAKPYTADEDGKRGYFTLKEGQEPTEEKIIGDYDGDGEFKLGDLAIMRDFLASNMRPADNKLPLIDVDGDGSFTIGDLVNLMILYSRNLLEE